MSVSWTVDDDLRTDPLVVGRSLADADLPHLEVVYLLGLALHETAPFGSDWSDMVFILGTESCL